MFFNTETNVYEIFVKVEFTGMATHRKTKLKGK